MTTNLKSASSIDGDPLEPQAPGWLKMGAVAAASGILGGLAAAWFYRKTLAQLREEAPHGGENPVSGNLDDQEYDI
ncbi:MAG: hypothetical protein P4L40_10740 [Terracidiphilus sp.]|nr:hypothetical protein [Terracidiphilus sp.]